MIQEEEHNNLIRYATYVFINKDFFFVAAYLTIKQHSRRRIKSEKMIEHKKNRNSIEQNGLG